MQVSEWQTIKTAPMDGTWVFLYFKGMSMSKYPTVGYNVIGYWEEVGGDETIEPTHWMPLPEPPK